MELISADLRKRYLVRASRLNSEVWVGHMVPRDRVEVVEPRFLVVVVAVVVVVVVVILVLRCPFSLLVCIFLFFALGSTLRLLFLLVIIVLRRFFLAIMWQCHDKPMVPFKEPGDTSTGRITRILGREGKNSRRLHYL